MSREPGDAELYRMQPRDRYQSDVDFHHLVDLMHAMIIKAQFSPSELREAAVLAACMYEERQTRSVYMRAGEIERPIR